jgi:peptide/nickel transport system substrate-binding protein
MRTALALLVSALVAVVGPALGEAKVLRTNLRADPAMVDPVTYSELVAGDVMKNLYEGFTESDKDGNVVPALATRWEASPDNKGFRFFLRKGVKFHSGREFTAKDVKWTFEQILIPGNKGGLTLTYLKVLEGAQDILDGKTTQLSGVKVIDPYTVEVRFSRPDVLFPIYPFQFMDSGIVAQNGTDWATKVIGVRPDGFALRLNDGIVRAPFTSATIVMAGAEALLPAAAGASEQPTKSP